MANCCDTSLSFQNEDTCKSPTFTNDQQEALRKDIEAKIAYDGVPVLDQAYDNYIECNICTKWNVPTDALRQIAKAHDVKIRAVGREDGVGFVQVVCIDANGEIVQDQEIGYAF